MDALSLLCTLHADGPATLQRLRGLGCGGLGAFLAMDADDLAEALGLEAAVARRLLREGRCRRRLCGGARHARCLLVDF